MNLHSSLISTKHELKNKTWLRVFESQSNRSLFFFFCFVIRQSNRKTVVIAFFFLYEID